MGKNSKIGWTTHTFNPWWGCTKVDDGCKNCYADTFAHRLGFNIWGPTASRRPMLDGYWNQLARWDRMHWQCDGCRELSDLRIRDCSPAEIIADGIASAFCKKCKEQQTWRRMRPRVFCASMADIFEGPATCQDADAYRVIVEGRQRLLRTIPTTPHLDYLLLTKRPENIPACGPWPRNVWVGTSVASQDSVHRAVTLAGHPEKLAVRFLSVEPLIGPVTLGSVLARIDWVIVGAESGAGARPYGLDWIRAIRDECVTAGVAFYLKQYADSKGKKIEAPELDGKVWQEFPTPRLTYTEPKQRDAVTRATDFDKTTR